MVYSVWPNSAHFPLNIRFYDKDYRLKPELMEDAIKGRPSEPFLKLQTHIMFKIRRCTLMADIEPPKRSLMNMCVIIWGRLCAGSYEGATITRLSI